ncbi:MAG: PorT family protein [Chitinophagaceae bacterium]|nr:PorT family protein [Chitinophagaceae bacterium]
MKSFQFLPILFICLFGYFVSPAQLTTMGIRGGVSIPNLTAGASQQNPLNTGFSSRFGGDAAVFVDFGITPVFSIRPMLQYSAQGGKKNGLQAFPTPQEYAGFFPGTPPLYLYANFKNESKLNYLLLPVLANFGWSLSDGSSLKFYVNAGPFAGILITGKQVTSGSSPIYADDKGMMPLIPTNQPFDKDNDIKDQLHKFNAGAEANIGFSYKTGSTNRIFIEGGFNYGFVNIQKGTANGKNHAGAGTLALGYSWGLN